MSADVLAGYALCAVAIVWLTVVLVRVARDRDDERDGRLDAEDRYLRTHRALATANVQADLYRRAAADHERSLTLVLNDGGDIA